MTCIMFCIINCVVLTGCTSSGGEYQQTGTPSLRLEVRRASMEPVEGWERIDPPHAILDDETLYLNPTPELTNDDVRSTGVKLESSGYWTMVLRLNERATTRFSELSKKMAGETTKRERLALVIDGTPLVAPTVIAPMTDGVIPIDGPFSEDEARRIAKGIVGG